MNAEAWRAETLSSASARPLPLLVAYLSEKLEKPLQRKFTVANKLFEMASDYKISNYLHKTKANNSVLLSSDLTME